MKKYWISKFYFHMYIGILAAFILSFLWILKLFQVIPPTVGEACVIVTVWVLGIILMVYSLLFDFHGGRFAVDADGILVYVGLKCYKHPWESLTHCGIVDVDVGSVSNEVDTYWIYFSNHRLTIKERKVFLRKTRRDLVNIAFFQYEHEPFELALQYAPEHLRTQLEELPRPQKWKRTPFGWRR